MLTYVTHSRIKIENERTLDQVELSGVDIYVCKHRPALQFNLLTLI